MQKPQTPNRRSVDRSSASSSPDAARSVNLEGQSERAEPFLTVDDAAKQLNIPTWKLQRAIKLDIVPYYTFYNRRRLVRLSEVVGLFKKGRWP